MGEDGDIRRLVSVSSALRKLVEHSRVSERGIFDHLTRIGLHEYADEWERQAQELEARIVFLKKLSQEAFGKDEAGTPIGNRPPQAA
jgi:hypothetical protein